MTNVITHGVWGWVGLVKWAFQNLLLRIGLYIMSIHAQYHHEHDRACNRGMRHARWQGIESFAQ